MRILTIALAAGALMTASAASAATIADFQLNGSTANSAGGATLTDNSGGGLGATGITFAANGGPTITGLGALSVYSLETRFAFDAVSGFRKIADFFDRGSDTGFYVLNGALNFYPVDTGADPIAAGDLVTALLTRDASDTVRLFLNGVEQLSFNDSSGLAVISGTLHMFRDDFVTGGFESSSGFVDYVRLADGGGFTPGGVPEPATWAMMLAGFFGLGSMLRRRTAATAA